MAIFNAPFEKATLFYRPFIVLNIVYLLLVITPLIIIDIVIFYFIQWGYQLLIVGIETFVFSLAIIILSFLEFLKIKNRLFKDVDESYLAINPKMFDNAYTVAGGGVPPNENNQRVNTLQRVKGISQLEDSQSSYARHSFSYNAERKYEDATNLSSIGFMSRLNSNKGIMMDEHQKQNRMNLHNILNKLGERNPMFSKASINIMDYKDNQIFKKRKDYDPNVKLEDEDDFDQHDRKHLRRCQSYEDFREIDDTFAPNRKELIEGKCISYPPSPKAMKEIDHYLFGDQIDEIRDKLKSEFAFNNLYQDETGDEFDAEKEFGKLRARRVQTYGHDFHNFRMKKEEDKEEAEIDPDMAQSILDGVLGNLSEDDDDRDNQLVRRAKRDRMALAKKRKMEIPDFAIEDIMGEFDVDDQGNYIILRNEDNGHLEDKNEKRVNRRGYLVDRNGNIIDKKGHLIFKERELDSDDEIPPPYSFEKRKMQLLNSKPDKIEGYSIAEMAPEDDDHIWMDPRNKEFADTMSGDETPVESMMGETPGRYMNDKMSRKTKKRRGGKESTINEENINLDLESQKDTIKLGSNVRPGTNKSSNRTKRLISARVQGLSKEGRPGTTFDGYVRDVPFYMGQAVNIPDSRKNSPKGRKRLKRKGPHNDSLKKIYGNIDPFLYKDDSSATGVRLDKVVNLKSKKITDPFKLAESAEVQGKLGMINSDDEIDSDYFRHSRMDRVPSKYKDRSIFGDTTMKTKLNDIEGIYSKKLKANDSDIIGRKTQHNSRVMHYGNKNSNTITRNMLTSETSGMGTNQFKSKKKKESRPSVDHVLKPRGIEEGGWI